MKTVRSQAGSVALVVALAVSIVLLIASVSFAFWAYGQRSEYKNNADQLVATAIRQAKQEESQRKDAEFAEISKSPLKTYVGPEAYGTINLKYPKTWSGYVVNSDSGPYVDAYFSPSVVPSVDDEKAKFALRVQVSDESYSSILENYQSLAEDGSVRVAPYKFPRVKNVVGSKITGTLDNDKRGTLIVVPLRANALLVWTESDAYLKDFNKYILPNIKFSP